MLEMQERTPQVQVRTATLQDAHVISSVLQRAFAEYEGMYTKEGYAATAPAANKICLRLKQGPVWVALYGDRVVGTASAVAKPTGLYVRGMAVLPVARGLRIGHALLDEVQRFAATKSHKRLFLSTTPFLDRAIRLYKAFGFQRTSEGPHDLFGTPLFTMEKVLRAGRSAQDSHKGDLLQAADDRLRTPDR